MPPADREGDVVSGKANAHPSALPTITTWSVFLKITPLHSRLSPLQMSMATAKTYLVFNVLSCGGRGNVRFFFLLQECVDTDGKLCSHFVHSIGVDNVDLPCRPSVVDTLEKSLCEGEILSFLSRFLKLAHYRRCRSVMRPFRSGVDPGTLFAELVESKL